MRSTAWRRSWRTGCSPAATPIAGGWPRRPFITGACAAGDVLEIGGRRWEIIVGTGHAPEHACLWCAGDDILISGDQILPKITPNISVWASEPDASPLEDYLGSFTNFAGLPDDALVLPSHNLPFRGVQTRTRPDRRPSPGAAGAAVRRVRRRFPRRFPRRFRARAPVCGGRGAAIVPARTGHPPDGVRDGRMPGPTSPISKARGTLTGRLDPDGIHRFERT